MDFYLFKGDHAMTKSVLVRNEIQKIQHRSGFNELKSDNSPNSMKVYPCINGCGRTYKLLSSLTRHLNLVIYKNILNFN